MLSLSPLPPHTHMLCLSPAHICPHFSLGPCDWIFCFFRCPSQKRKKLPATAAHLPAGDVLPQTFPHGSIHHSWPHPGSTGLQQREGASPPPRGELDHPTHTLGCLPGALPSCWHPSSGHYLMRFPGPSGRGGEGKGEAAGEGERGRKGRGLHL